MKNSQTTHNVSKINPITGYRAIIIALFSLALLHGTSGATAADDNDNLPEFYLPSLDVDAISMDIQLPKPVKVTAPAVHRGLNGTELTMTFYISKSGKVTLIDDDASPYNNEEFELACLMHRKLRTWQFEPARDRDGNAISVKVELPVEVVAKGSVPSVQLASISVKRPVIVAVSKR